MTFLEVADRIGARLCRDAIWSGGQCSWMGRQRMLGPDLYAGTSGVGLFLHSLAEATGEPIFRQTAAAALDHALEQAGQVAPPIRAGLYSGWGGISYAMARTQRLSSALQLARGIGTPQLPHVELDLITGSAGAIIALLGLGLVETAAQHGEALLDAAEQGDTGTSWRTLRRSRTGSRPNLTGMSHGAAGIGWALLELFATTGEDRFRATAEDAFRYERSLYNGEVKNWPDFRTNPTDYPVWWCHGATGIGFSRLRAWRILGSVSCRQEADLAVDTTDRWLRNATEGNFSLCHGACGGADLLIEEELVEQASRALRSGIDRYEEARAPWRCGQNGAGEVPGLMLGVAGIGYTCLRLTDPVRFPSVLLPLFGETARHV